MWYWSRTIPDAQDPDESRRGGQSWLTAENSSSAGLTVARWGDIALSRRRAALRAALECVSREVSPTIMRAFVLFAIEQETAEVVAEQLSISPRRVHLAKQHVLAKLRRRLRVI